MKRTRRIQERLVKAKEQTETIVRCNTGIKGAAAYRLLESWHDDKVSNCDDADMYSIPKREYFYKWYESAMKNADLNYELKQMLKHGKRNAEIELKDNKLIITIDLV